MKLFSFVLVLMAYVAQAQNDSLKVYTTARLSGAGPVIDGHGNDPAWEQVEWSDSHFTQVEPDKGKPASVNTKFKILYDAKNLYVLVRAYDPEPDKIVKRMSRRDGFDGDMVEINIDSYYDKRTAFSFTASVSGVKGDEYVSNNGDNWDPGWDPIWYLKTSIDAEGWLAEFRIPLSQLRFANKPELTWGLNVTRIFFRTQERSHWQYVPPDAGGYVHLMGEMNGIRGIKPQKQLEIQPYVVGRTERFDKEEGNPFVTGTNSGLDVGLDAKIGLTSDITLDLTVNPDFGQVEADPSQVNLSAFELFFREQRPFFTEGNNTLDFPVTGNSSNLFYSRRIGRRPQGGVDTDASGEDSVTEYIKSSERSTILGAAKLTGKNKKGFSWGLLESVTANEYAEIDSLGFRRKQLIEPLTNYLAGRVQQDINKGNTVVGAMLTATNRQLDNPNLQWLHKNAYSAGIDFTHHWKERKYFVSSRAVMSHVQGTPEAIEETQRSSERYFQRIDNNHTELDPTRRSLTGTSGTLRLGKKSGKLIGTFNLDWQSPELDLNDVGFLSQTDRITQWFWMQYRILQPRGITRWQRYNINQWQEYDFGGRNLNTGINTNAHAQFNNFWQTGGGVTFIANSASNGDLRGGPSIRYPGATYFWMYLETDRRKKFSLNINPELGTGKEGYSRNVNLSLNLTYRPVNALNISLSPSFSRNREQMQYVATASENNEDVYVVGQIDQTTARLVMRMTLMLTPNLSVQYYGQPFGTSGKYTNFKRITNASASEYSARFAPINPATLLLADDVYSVDANNDGMGDYNFNKPDFNFGQFRSNTVVRWEYIPGSTLFLVWARERNGAFYATEPEHEKYSFEFDEKGRNIFLIKFTYRLVM